MEAISAFSLEQHPGPNEQRPRRTRLFRDGIDTGATVPGYVIEAQYRCKQGFLLIVSQDCPFEESNDFLLLGPDYKLLASRALIYPYETFILHSHAPAGENSLRLVYHDGLSYTLSVAPAGWKFWRSYRLTLRRIGAADNANIDSQTGTR
ncbi:hypothetical protein SAMN06265795_1158 [Noviherbaspirillum humi]|uniref:Uncharacterized protein n=1 Tax=Noviherbaspirillum humi TaxID=1688639 RepID=A0A239K6C8_9BURK|nr:hypothetical protein [Noviherbaspirillum humi]SNT14016.1 hypothetical protein SAMN06265795_1158 [Noviherbaspirillum humi]